MNTLSFPRHLFSITVILVLFIAQQALGAGISVQLAVRDNGNGQGTLTFGFDRNATHCIDPLLGEFELPPLPPTGIFNTRFTDPRDLYGCTGQGLLTDYRTWFTSSVTDTFQLQFQAGQEGGFPVRISWPPNLSTQFSSLYLHDLFGGVLINVNMLSDTSIMITNSAFSILRIIATPVARSSSNEPEATTDDPTNISFTSATLNGTVNPNGATTITRFEWGTSIAYGNLTSYIDISAATAPKPISTVLTGLNPMTKYHYRVIASNPNGIARGLDKSFTTSDSTVHERTSTALKFHGANDYVNIPDSPVLSAIGDHFTLEFWMKIDALPSTPQELIGKWGCAANEDDEFGFNIEPDGRVFAGISGLANWYSLSSDPIPLGRWTHISVVFDRMPDSSAFTIYLNGEVNQRKFIPSGFTMNRDTDQPFRIGTYDLCFFPSFKGYVDDVRMWNVSRTRSEIMTNMNGSLAGNEAGLLGYWRFDEGNGFIAHDATNNHNDGSLVNGPEWVPTLPPPQPGLHVPLYITDSSMVPHTPLYFGVDVGATRCIDPALGEKELPPPPPIGTYDARFVDPRGPGECFGQGLLLDLRSIIICITTPCTQIDTYKVRFQDAANKYPITLSWPDLHDKYSGSVTMIVGSGDLLSDIDMKAQTSISISDPSLSSVFIIAEGPILGPPPPHVRVTTRPATDLTPTSSELHGFVNGIVRMPPRDFTDHVYFEWGTTSSYGHQTPHMEAWVVDSLPFTYNLNGLDPATEYHYRAVFQSDYLPPLYGNDEVFTTSPLVLTEQPQIFSVRDVPNDQGGFVTLKWFTSSLDTNVSMLPFYSIWRALPEQFAAKIKPTEPGRITLDFQGHAYRTETIGGKLYAWEWITNVPAHRFTTYSFTAPTLFDSSSTSDGTHHFLVSAQTSDPNEFYDSNVMSGYSVDNTTPYPPNDLQAIFASGIVTLRWNSSMDKDVSNYLVYRSNQPGVSLSDMTLVGTTTETLYNDAGPFTGSKLYYTVCARDKSGNTSGPAAQIAAIILGVLENGDGIPATFALYQNYPNPFNPRTTIDVDLPSAGFTTLKVFNTLGQEAAVLLNNSLSAGRYRISYDASALISGVYYYRLTVTDAGGQSQFTQVKKFIFMK